MASMCMPCFAFLQTDVSGLLSAGEETSRLAQELVDLSNQSQERSRSLIGYAETSRGNMEGLTERAILKPEIFVKILDLVDDTKLGETIQGVKAMRQLSKECVDKSAELSKSIQKSMDCLPKNMQEEQDKLDREVAESSEEEEDIDLESEIADLKRCTEGIRDMNIFTVAKKGTAAFVGLIKECRLLDDLFDRIKELASKVAQIVQAFMLDTCCAKVVAGISSLKDLKRSLKLSMIITKFADSCQRLIDAILELFETVRTTFAKFIPQFEAGKKFQHSPFMKHVSNFASQFPMKRK
jgi:Zn-dependent M32 family carboxypeptidase